MKDTMKIITEGNEKADELSNLGAGRMVSL